VVVEPVAIGDAVVPHFLSDGEDYYLVERDFVLFLSQCLIGPENPEYLVELLHAAVHVFQLTAKYSKV
jgi:hypothetical protein